MAIPAIQRGLGRDRGEWGVYKVIGINTILIGFKEWVFLSLLVVFYIFDISKKGVFEGLEKA